MTIACDIHPINNLRVLVYLERTLQATPAAVNGWYRNWVGLGFATLEALLVTGPDTRFADGDSPGIVDVHLVPQLYNARRYEVDLAPYPRLVSIADRAAELPEFRAAAPPRPSMT